MAEGLGTALLLAAVVGSGVMGERHVRTGVGPWTAELTATFGLLGVIAGCARARPRAQVLGASAATALFRWLVPSLPARAQRDVVADDEEDAA